MLRTKTDLRTQRAYREVVDGQQRLRAIKDFASDDLVLTKTAKEYAGLQYSRLDDESKTRFLTYSIGTVQLFNIPDDDVLDVFHRINAYGLRLSPQEMRHGKFQGEFRNAVIDASKRWVPLWDAFQVVGLRNRVRMADDELMALMMGVVLEGVTDGGQPKTNKLYERYDKHIPKHTERKLNDTIKFIITELSQIMETALSRGPHFLMLFAAVSHALYGIPAGDIGEEDMPSRNPKALTDMEMVRANLGDLADILHSSDVDIPRHLVPFKVASAGTTQRIRGRKARFLALYQALLPTPIY